MEKKDVMWGFMNRKSFTAIKEIYTKGPISITGIAKTDAYNNSTANHFAHYLKDSGLAEINRVGRCVMVSLTDEGKELFLSLNAVYELMVKNGNISNKTE